MYRSESPSVKYFTDRSKAVLFVDLLCFCVFCFSCFSVYSLLSCGHLLRKFVDDFIVLLLISLVVSWVRCGTWLYRFLVFAVFLTFIQIKVNVSLNFRACIIAVIRTAQRAPKDKGIHLFEF